MPKQRYKGSATGISFKQRGSGLARGESRLVERQKQDIDAIKLAKIQNQENNSNFISGTADSLNFERGVLTEKQKLEAKVRAHELSAFDKFAKTDVARLEGEAKAKKEYAEYLKDLAPKAAANFAKLAEGGLRAADKLKGIAEWNNALADGVLDKVQDGIPDLQWKLAEKGTDDQIKLDKEGDVEGARYIRKTTINLSTYWAQREFYDMVRNNKAGFQNEIIEHYNNAKGSDIYGESNAVKIMDLGARELLAQVGIPERSAVGIELIQQFRTWGSLDRNKFYEDRKVDETIKDHEDIFSKWKAEPDLKIKKTLFKNLVLSTRHGWYKNGKTGAVSNPNKGQVMTYGDASIESLKYIAKRMAGEPGWESWDKALEHFSEYNSLIVNKDDKPIPLTKRFATRIDEEVKETWTEAIDKKTGAKDEKRKLKGKELLVDYQQKYDDLINNKVLTQKGKERQRLDTLAEIKDLKGINEAERSKLYASHGYEFDDSKSNVLNYLNFHNAKLDGDEFTMMRAYGASKDKATLTKDVELIQRINKEYTTQFKGFHDDNNTTFNSATKNSFRGEELNAKRELSTKLANDFFQARIQDRIKGGESIQEAQKNERDLLAIGVAGEEKDNPYFTEHSDLYGKRIFVNFSSEHDIKVGVVNDYLYNSEKSEAAWDKVKNTKVIAASITHIRDIVNSESTSLVGKARLEEVVKNKKMLASLVEPERMNAIKESLHRIKEGYPLEDISGLIPGNIYELAKETGVPAVTVMNTILEEYFGKEGENPKYYIGSDSQAVAIQMNGGKYVPSKDVAAFNLYNEAIRGKGFLPMNPITRECTQENREPIEAFKKVKGLEWSTENGGFIVDDMPAFYENDGVTKLIAAGYGENLLNSHGFDIIMQALYKKPDNRSIGRFNTRN